MPNETSLLVPFWIEVQNIVPNKFGVTAYSVDDAFLILEKFGFSINKNHASITKNIKFTELDQNHVVPNMGLILRRGIWFPNLNSSTD